MKTLASSASSTKLVQELSRELFHFGDNSGQRKQSLLTLLLQRKDLKPLQIKEYTRCLLFIAAYPETLDLHKTAINSLNGLFVKIKALTRKNRSTLEQSGLPGTRMMGVYSFRLVYWLLQNTRIALQLAYLEEGAVHPSTVVKEGLDEMEFELENSGTYSPIKWLEMAFGTADRSKLLQDLIQHLNALPLNDQQKDQLFESLRVCISFECVEHVPVLRFSTKTVLQHDGILKRFDEKALLAKPLTHPKKLSTGQRKDLIYCARLSLLFLNRETDPVSLCDEKGLEYYELERGFSIAFFSAVADRRLPLESYIGFMMFKNGYPVSYGGAWLFGKRSLLGINIYESYRGGESAYLFAQLLRSYKQRFSPSYIEVEPYQFGKGNPEGIKTGAFWFYYRFGFTPVEKSLQTLAAREFEKIRKNKSYRTPVKILKAFTACNMALRLEEKVVNLDPSIISIHITQYICDRFKGSRSLFSTWALEQLKTELGIEYAKLNRDEKTGVRKLMAFVSICLDLKNAEPRDRANLRLLLMEKGKSEFNYAELCEKFPFEKLITSTTLRKSLGLYI